MCKRNESQIKVNESCVEDNLLLSLRNKVKRLK